MFRYDLDGLRALSGLFPVATIEFLNDHTPGDALNFSIVGY